MPDDPKGDVAIFAQSYLGSVAIFAQHLNAKSVVLWEWYSGSASLSTFLKHEHVSHLPPLDYRYGWNLSNVIHQSIAIRCLLSIRVETLFASPNCAPWGNNSRCLPKDVKVRKREEETLTLTFLAAACFIQHLLYRKYILENSAYSDIFHDSRLKTVRGLFFFMIWLYWTSVPVGG